MIQTLRLFFEGNYKELFGEHVFQAEIISIKYYFKQNDVDFEMLIGTDDAATVKLTFDNMTLQDENAKKIAMIREVLDFDKEAERSLLRELFK